MDGEVTMPQPEIPAPTNWRRLIIVFIAVVIVFLLAIAWLGDWAINQRAGRPTLSEAQKQEILRSLALPPGTKLLTRAQQAEILNSLRLPPNTTPLTAAQKAEIMKSLE